MYVMIIYTNDDRNKTLYLGIVHVYILEVLLCSE